MNASIPEHVLDEIRARSDILEVVSQHVPLKKKGRNYFGLCPFHTEKTPSFSVNQEKQIFHCFGCGSGGDVFRFLMELDKVSFVEAVRSLAQRSGLSLPESRVDVAKASANEQLYRACEFARDYFHAMLLNDKRAEPARAYLRDRAIAEETISRFKLGSAIPGWDHLLNAAARSSLSEKLLESAGLVVPRADDGYYDRFRNRLIFPVDTASGRTVAFAGRALTSETEPKYLNSPETPIYHKGELLYGLAEARDAVRKDGYVLLVEGYVDALRLFQAGIENVVACAGTAFTEAHAWSLARYGPKVVLVYDADPAGESATLRSLDILASAGLESEVIALPQGHDPDSFVRDQGPDALLRLVSSAIPMMDYKLAALSASVSLQKVEGKRRGILELAETLARVPDGVRRNLLIADLADKLGVAESTVRQAVVKALKSARRRPGTDASAPSRVAVEAPAGVERDLIRLMLRRPNVAEKVSAQFALEDFVHEPYRSIAAAILQACQDGHVPEAAAIMDRCDQSLAPLVSDLATDISISRWLDDLDRDEIYDRSEREILRKMRWDVLDRKQQAAEAELRTALEAGDQAAAAELYAESHRLNMEKRALGEIQKNT